MIDIYKIINKIMNPSVFRDSGGHDCGMCVEYSGRAVAYIEGS